MELKPRSKPLTSTVAYFVAVGGELFILRGLLLEGRLSGILLTELAFCILIVFGALFSATPKGWRSKTGNRVALGLFAVYLIFNISCFTYFKELYLSVLVTEHQSYGPALEAVKLVLVMIGTVAAIPVVSGPSGREYMRGLERAVQRQQADWAKGGANEAKENLNKTARNLKESLSQEEITELIAQLKQDAPSPEEMKQGGSISPKEEPDPEGFSAEDWKGYGCG